MYAYVLHGIGDLRYEQTVLPKLKEGWALIEVMAAGICGSDIPRIFETGTYHFPTIPGHEFSGIVRNVADPSNKNLIGKRVGVFPLIPCRKCENCLAEHYEMCTHYDYIGSRRDGGFAEYAAVPVWNLIELPDCVSYREAAMLEPAAVALHAIRQLTISEIHSIAIYGIGTIGMLMAQWARILGISKILLIGNKEGQTVLAKQLGFAEVCNQNEQNALEWLAQNTFLKNLDAVAEGVGRDSILEQCIESVRSKGTILLVGNPHDDVDLKKNIYWQLLRRQLRVVGTWNSSFHTSQNDDWKFVLEALEAGKIKISPLITHNIPFAELSGGLQLMKNKTEYYNKVMVTMQQKD